MTDSFGRNIDYIRISITDRCNLRCTYCMPSEGVESIPHSKILSFTEIERLVRILAKQGLKKVKITGGEPLVRKGVVNLVKALKAIENIESVTITTNGVLLLEYYDQLIDAKIDAITISLDTLNEVKYNEITRRNQLITVKKAIDYAIKMDKIQLRLNCVVSGNDYNNDIINLVEYARAGNIDIRFIEVMPIGMGRDAKFISEAEIKTVITQSFGELTAFEQKRGNGPSKYFSLKGFKGKIGFISAVSHTFCDSCNRIRLTADGFLKTCLQYDIGVNIKDSLQPNVTDSEIINIISKAINEKPKSHVFNNPEEYTETENRKMYQIGG